MGDSSPETTPTGFVSPVNSAPTVSRPNTDQTAAVGDNFQYDATQSRETFVDIDGDAISYSVSLNPNDSGLSATNGEISGVPTRSGRVSVTVTGDDGNNGQVTDIFDIVVSIDQDAILAKFAGVIDLENLENYASQTVPAHIIKFHEDNNPITDAGATLGRVLFYDPSLSIDDTISCASCHSQSAAFSDLAQVSVGVESGLTARHSMRLINTQFADEFRFFWDERAESHEEQETQPIRDHNEQGFSGQAGRPDFNAFLAKLQAIDYYQELFKFAFLDDTITEERIQLALAQFVKSIHSFDPRFDEGRSQVNNNNADFPNFAASENLGKQLFMTPRNQGGAGCAGCHRPPEFDIGPNSRSNGVVGVANDPLASDLIVTRSPTLRDVVRSDGTMNGAAMHDGSLTTLGDVIDHYDNIVIPSNVTVEDFLAALDNRLQTGGTPQSLGLSASEKQQLEDFLRTLSGQNVYTDPKLADPF